MYSYKQCENDILVQIKLYRTTRKNNPWDYETFKNVSDELSEALVFFGPVAAELRSASERAKMERELYFEERLLHWQKDLGKERGNSVEIKARALIDCRDKFNEEIDARGKYYKAREIIDRIDQELNSISRRFKEKKHDIDGNNKD